LVTKFCIGGVEGDVQPSFLVFASALFPQHNFYKMSCVEATGYYVYEYNTAMLQAKKKGYIDDRFRVEGATPCAVAKLSGFVDEKEGEGEGEYKYKQTIKDNILKLCNIDEEKEIEDKNENGGTNPMISTKNTYNKGQLLLDWGDLLGGKHGSKKKKGDRDLQQRLKKMTQKDLGYK